MEFKEIAKKIRARFDTMSHEALFRVDVDRDTLWDLYLKSFPVGTNPIYKERTEHDCNCCKNFIRDVGNVVIIKDNKIQTIWDIELEGFYGVVAKAMSEFVKKQAIVDVFTHREKQAGVEISRQMLENGSVYKWNHFSCSIPNHYVSISPEKLNEARTTVQVFERGLKEITTEAIDSVLDLIGQDLYRGDEHRDAVVRFQTFKRKISDLTDSQRNIFLWDNYKENGSRIRNTVIGTLLTDISESVDIEKAVKSFEDKVSGTNYKRPTAIRTKGMVNAAMKTIKELGIEESVYRRFAVAEDISVNNVLFADRSTASIMKDGLEEKLMASVTDNKDYSKVEDITIDDFIEKVLPDVTEIEAYFENKHTNNLMSLIAPKDEESPNILKWNNNFSWSYSGNVADSIKERVKNAGGNVDGVLRFSLSWFNYDDLDIRVKEPCGNTIYFSNMMNPRTSGHLDVDMNAGGGETRNGVENITWSDRAKMNKGKYVVKIHNYAKRETSNVGFVVESECNGEINNYSYSRAVGDDKKVTVLEFEWNGSKMINLKIGKEITGGSLSQEVWNLNTEKFHKVNMLTISPNHWDGQKIGNKHFFFILDKCLNDNRTRGIYNEFLGLGLEKHRKVFEMIGDITKCEVTANQVSGIGLSSTKRDSLLCRVSGNFNRILRIKF